MVYGNMVTRSTEVYRDINMTDHIEQCTEGCCLTYTTFMAPFHLQGSIPLLRSWSCMGECLPWKAIRWRGSRQELQASLDHEPVDLPAQLSNLLIYHDLTFSEYGNAHLQLLCGNPDGIPSDGHPFEECVDASAIFGACSTRSEYCR